MNRDIDLASASGKMDGNKWRSVVSRTISQEFQRELIMAKDDNSAGSQKRRGLFASWFGRGKEQDSKVAVQDEKPAASSNETVAGGTAPKGTAQFTDTVDYQPEGDEKAQLEKLYGEQPQPTPLDNAEATSKDKFATVVGSLDEQTGNVKPSAPVTLSNAPTRTDSDSVSALPTQKDGEGDAAGTADEDDLLCVETFLERIRENKLLSSSELNEAVEAVGEPPEFQASEEDEVSDTQKEAVTQYINQLGQWLLDNEKITVYQLKVLRSSVSRRLLFGNYIVIGSLGKGGMGQVFKAVHRRMERVVALKVLFPENIRSDDDVNRFYQEVTTAGKLDHPNIVTTHDADEEDGVHYLVMEYVDGKDLATVVTPNNLLSAKQAIEYTKQVSEGLAYAHEKGIIHRDIKPHNLLLDHDGTVKILDMGLARLEAGKGESKGVTRTGEFLGTVDYMPYEQGRDAKSADRRSDIYSLGCTLFFFLNGKPPFDGGSIMEKIFAKLNKQLPHLHELRNDVPKALDDVFQKMSAKNPDDRYQSIADMLKDLNKVKT